MEVFSPADQVLFKKYFWDYLQIALFHPANTKVLAAALIFGFVVFTIVFIKVHNSSNTSNSGTLTGVFAAFFGLLSLAVMPPLARIFIMKTNALPPHYDMWTIAATVFILFAMVVPFSRMLFRSTYGASLGAWVLSLTFAFMIVAGTGYVHDNVLSEKKKSSPAEQNEPLPMPSEEDVKKALEETGKELGEAAEKAKTAVEESAEKIQEKAQDSMQQAEEVLQETPSN